MYLLSINLLWSIKKSEKHIGEKQIPITTLTLSLGGYANPRLVGQQWQGAAHLHACKDYAYIMASSVLPTPRK